MALPISFAGQTLLDNTVKDNGQPESTSWQVPVTTLTAANYVAKKALIDALYLATSDLVLGNVASTTITIAREVTSGEPAPSVQAQRENKMLCRYHDAVTGQKFRVSIGTFELSQLMPHSEFVDLTDGAGLAFKAAFEAIVVSPDNSSNGVVLESIQFVGRNS